MRNRGTAAATAECMAMTRVAVAFGMGAAAGSALAVVAGWNGAPRRSAAWTGGSGVVTGFVGRSRSVTGR